MALGGETAPPFVRPGGAAVTSPSSLEQAQEKAARIIHASTYTIALVGAGISVESGVPPFRGPGGLWTKHGEPPMDGYQRFLADPRAWWADILSRQGEHSEFIKALSEAKPNAAHRAMADLEKLGFLKHIITQNIDNLHQEAGSVAITEIHGNRLKLRCIACNTRWPLGEFPTDEIPPRCRHCGGIVKTDTVMFGEPIPLDALESCQRESRLCDCMLLVGTSAVVYPAAEFPVIAFRRGAKLIEINPMETPLSDVSAAVLRAPAGEVMPKLVERLKELSGAGAG
jgi:NAD-dependent deacetylase